MKRILKKTLKLLAYFILTVLLIFILLIFTGGPKLPDNTDQLINTVINEEPVEQITGDSSSIYNAGVKVWYEALPPSSVHKGDILLFMGISNDALGWPNEFLDALRAEGYRLIRFDYRDTGLSDWVEDYEKSPYSLSDLSNDASLILDALNIEKCHLIGVSLGGMVAQQFAIEHEERSLSLTSIMSSGNIVDSELPGISFKTLGKLVRSTLKYNIIPSDKNLLKSHIAYRKILQGDAQYELNSKEILDQVWFNYKKRNAYNNKASEHHQKATLKSGSRYNGLKELKLPILIIHGKNDPLIPIVHSQKLAQELPNAIFHEIDNMGHDIAPIHLDNLINILDGFLERE